MSLKKMMMVRIYTTESTSSVKPITEYLQSQGIKGVSVFRAIKGYGQSGNHSASLLNVSLNLPLVIEFFDEEKKIEALLEPLKTMVKAEHLICWPVHTMG